LVKEYIHQPLEQEITAIGGHYTVTEELRLPFEGREILYLKGYALLDSSCCGLKGCAFVHVKGFLVDWKFRKNQEGLELSLVEPVDNERIRSMIRKRIQEKEVFHQVQFD
jgi:hypothetical protein